MKKRLLAGLLLAFMLIVSAVPVFAVPEAAPADGNGNTATEAAPEAEAGIPAEALETPVFPELPEANNITVKDVALENNTLSFVLENNSNEPVGIPFILLDFDTAKIQTNVDYQNIFPAELAPNLEVNMKDGVIVLVQKALNKGDDLTVKVDAVLAEAQTGNPEIGLRLVTQGITAELNLSSQPAEIPERYMQSYDNLFDLAGASIGGGEGDETTPGEAVFNFVEQTGFSMLIKGIKDNWGMIVMILIACVLLYLAIVKKFEPLLLLPIAFGMLLTNLPGIGVFHEELFAGGHVHWDMFGGSGDITPGLIDYLYLGVKLGIYPCLIFVGVGAMTDFGPLIANPKSLLLGAAAQLGIFITYIVCYELFGFTEMQAASTGIIGGADGPTAIFVTSKLAPELLGPIAVAAYSYMALVPVIQPPIMKALTTKKERQIVMKPLREVSKTEKIVFPIVVTVFVSLLVPSAGPLVGSLMLGNLIKECGVAERLSKTVQNELMNIVTIFLGISVGATATANTFLEPKTLIIICVGVVAFGVGSAGGVLLAKFMNLFTKNKINPLIGSAGVSAVPMAARVSQAEGQKENPQNFLLMHAMGPNVAGVIGSAIAAGVLIALFG